MKTCRHCGTMFSPTPHQIKKSDYLCAFCRLRYDRDYRQHRRESGNRVISGQMSRDWQREYECQYVKRPGIHKRLAANQKRYREDPALRPRHRARSLLNRAVASNRIKKQPCVACGNLKVDAHHQDYQKPLDVQWLCRPCHAKQHHRAKAKGVTP